MLPEGKNKMSSKAYAELLEEMDKTSKLLVRRDLELTNVNAELDDKVKKLEEYEQKLREMNQVLEVKLRARTRELRENIVNLDKQVKERTEKLEYSQKALLNILEDFREEKRRAEIEKEKTVAIISNFSDGLLIFDNKNILTILNKRAEMFLGLGKQNYLGKNTSEISHDKSFKPLFEIIGAGINDVFRKEMEVNKDLVLEISVSPITLNEEMIGKFVILHDITRERKVQKLKTEFVSIAAHQLRTPLSAIKWTLTTLLEGDLGELAKEQKEYLEKTNLSNERMINLVDDLLNLSRIEEGRYVRKDTFVKLQDLVAKVIGELGTKADEKKVKMSFKAPAKLPEVLVDKEKIALAVQNLIENALNYSHRGSSISMSLKMNKGKQEIEFQVKDTGIGIPDDQKDRIFTKFFRAENAVKAETVGTGLGLFIDKNIVESHGGKIWFESDVKKGTTFHFTIPVKTKFDSFISNV